MYYNNV